MDIETCDYIREDYKSSYPGSFTRERPLKSAHQKYEIILRCQRRYLISRLEQ